MANRRAVGFKLQVQGYHLLSFARYADRHGARGRFKTKQAIRWACLPKSGDRVYWAQRLAIVRTFAKRLQVTEPRTEIPPRHVFGPSSRRNPPHLYTRDDIDLLLNRAGRLPGRIQPRTFQVLIGLLVCTGLRISEALHLKASDVDLDQAVITIREGKGGRTRLVPLHATALAPLKSYARHRQKIVPLADYFLASERGTALAYSTVAHRFLQLRRGIPHGRRAPRLHDLRHTFACRVLKRWQNSGEEPSQRIAVLSRFLGHTHIADTYWYFEAFPQLLEKATRHLELSNENF